MKFAKIASGDLNHSREGLELSPDYHDGIAEPHPKREVVRSRIFR